MMFWALASTTEWSHMRYACLLLLYLVVLQRCPYVYHQRSGRRLPPHYFRFPNRPTSPWSNKGDMQHIPSLDRFSIIMISSSLSSFTLDDHTAGMRSMRYASWIDLNSTHNWVPERHYIIIDAHPPRYYYPAPLLSLHSTNCITTIILTGIFPSSTKRRHHQSTN